MAAPATASLPALCVLAARCLAAHSSRLTQLPQHHASLTFCTRFVSSRCNCSHPTAFLRHPPASTPSNYQPIHLLRCVRWNVCSYVVYAQRAVAVGAVMSRGTVMWRVSCCCRAFRCHQSSAAPLASSTCGPQVLEQKLLVAIRHGSEGFQFT